MSRRKLLIGLVSGALLAGGLAAGVHSASAQLHTLVVTLSDGSKHVVSVDVPPGGPITLPSFSLPVVNVTDITPPSQTTPVTPQPGAAQPGQTAPPTTTTTTTTTTTQTQQQQGKGKKKGSSRLGKTKVEQRKGANASPGTPQPAPHQPTRQANGVPTTANPSFTQALPGAAPVGVPDFFIDHFSVPPFLIGIYQAAGIQYNVPWQVLCGINSIETNFGQNLSTSSAGAVGWMQFLPSTWKKYGVDANADKLKDPNNPLDAIFAAARYLHAAGADKDLRRAIFAYNHADWYVNSVLLRSKVICGMPDALVGSLTGLTEGYFPVAAKASYADDSADAQSRPARPRQPSRDSIDIYSDSGAPVIAVSDAVVKHIGNSKSLGHFIVLQDAYGNRYTYGHLGKVAPSYPTPKPRKITPAQVNAELKLPARDAKPTQPASAGAQHLPRPKATHKIVSHPVASSSTAPAEVSKERLFANPSRPNARKAGGDAQLLTTGRPVAGYSTFASYFKHLLGLSRDDVVIKKLAPGAQVVAGTILGRVGKSAATPRLAPHLNFQIRPAGRGAPRIDPKPILDGWKILERSAFYRAAGQNPFLGPNSKNPTIGQIFLMGKETLAARVLGDPGIKIYDCGRRDIRAGLIDSRVLATLLYLRASGLDPTVTALECGHSLLTSSGNVSEHSTGDAVDIGAINGIPILGHQGKGSITEIAIKRLLMLQGRMKPHQIISLMTFQGADNTLSMPDHANHIHVGFHPLYNSNAKFAAQIDATLKPAQWIKLVDRLNQIGNPAVATAPSKFAVKVTGANLSGE